MEIIERLAEMTNPLHIHVCKSNKLRGAGMGLYSIFGPDILEFIRCKTDLNAINRFNLSVSIPDEFYDLLNNNPNSIHMVRFKDGTRIPLVDNGKEVTVKELWDEICTLAHKCAEPGILNHDIANRQCSVTNVYPRVGFNP